MHCMHFSISLYAALLFLVGGQILNEFFPCATAHFSSPSSFSLLPTWTFSSNEPLNHGHGPPGGKVYVGSRDNELESQNERLHKENTRLQAALRQEIKELQTKIASLETTLHKKSRLVHRLWKSSWAAILRRAKRWVAEIRRSILQYSPFEENPIARPNMS